MKFHLFFNQIVISFRKRDPFEKKLVFKFFRNTLTFKCDWDNRSKFSRIAKNIVNSATSEDFQTVGKIRKYDNEDQFHVKDLTLIVQLLNLETSPGRKICFEFDGLQAHSYFLNDPIR